MKVAHVDGWLTFGDVIWTGLWVVLFQLVVLPPGLTAVSSMMII